MSSNSISSSSRSSNISNCSNVGHRNVICSIIGMVIGSSL